MPGGGRLTLRWERDGGEAVLRIGDTGPGIPADILPRIFDMHFTTKSSGTGIGLYVAHTVLDANGGSLRVIGTGPEGTTFEIRLPLFKEG
jgi:signal transduction histidine kinase